VQIASGKQLLILSDSALQMPQTLFDFAVHLYQSTAGRPMLRIEQMLASAHPVQSHLAEIY
jgi:hypothetical protein